MADKNFRAMGLYLGKKIAEVTEHNIKFMSNSEQLFGFDAVLGESTGIVTSEGSMTLTMPVEGTEVDFVSLVTNQTPVEVGYEFNGTIYKIKGKLTECDNKSTSKAGTQVLTATFRGGKPAEAL